MSSFVSANMLAGKPGKPAMPKTPRRTKKNTDEIVQLGPLSAAIRQYAKETRGSDSSDTLLGFNIENLHVVFTVAKTRCLPDAVTYKQAMAFEALDLIALSPVPPTKGSDKGRTYLVRPLGRKLIADFTKEVVNISMKHLVR